MLRDTIKWRPSLIGALIVAAFYMVANFSGESLLFSFFLLGGIIVGYMVNHNWKCGAVNGLTSGIIAVVIVNLVSVILLAIQGYAAYLTLILSSLAAYIVMELVLSAVGGVLGFLIRSESLPVANSESTEKEE